MTKRGHAALAVALALFVAALAQLQLERPRLLDSDSYFHARAAQELAAHGVRTTFPQTVFSTWSRSYSDKDFLFHVFLIPFVGPSASVKGAKLAAIVADGLLMLAFGFALVRLRVRFAWVFALLFAASDPWIWLHLLKVRPHLLGLALVIVEIVLVLGGRWKSLAAVSAAHVLTHTSFVLAPAFPLVHAAARRLRGQPVQRRTIAGVALGIGAASLLHPYFPHNLTVAFDQVVEVARAATGTNLDLPADIFGSELLPMTVDGFARFWPVWVPAAAAAVGLLVRWRRTPPSVEALTLFGFAGLVLGASVVANRFMFFFVPVTLLAAARGFSEIAGATPVREFARRAAPAAAMVLLVGCVIAGGLRLAPASLRGRVAASTSRVEDLRAAVAFLDSRAAPGDVVYHNFWVSFAALYYLRPEGRYIEALDPIFLYRFDPRLFAGMLAVYRGSVADAYAVVAGDFGARFAFVQRSPGELPMARALAQDARFTLVYSDAYAFVFEVAR